MSWWERYTVLFEESADDGVYEGIIESYGMRLVLGIRAVLTSPPKQTHDEPRTPFDAEGPGETPKVGKT